MQALAIGGLGAPELLIVLAVLVLLFGASKLPELARGSGRALRIFKAETSHLGHDDDEDAVAIDPIAHPVVEPVVTDPTVDVVEAQRRDSTR
ncbi:twin-arginine translocase TatA/TatE family subunit [Nocardioides sp.]|uniref:twin-arginine translocase TatA/TatE family subunit n=1 Tax=Nocardioides sp. TaxID=35761 RepID=UPI003784F94B